MPRLALAPVSVVVVPKERIMTVEVTVSGFVPAVMIYRRAVAMAKQARRRANQHAETGNQERRLREIDATIETVILAQAAAEGWIHAAYRLAKIEPRDRTSWSTRWADAPEAICGAGTRPLDRATTATLDWLSAWRNWLVHDDARARKRLGRIVPLGRETDHLTANLAEEVIRRMDDAFTDIGAVIGHRTLAGLNSAFLWTALDEC
jgi:hypothetical protein